MDDIKKIRIFTLTIGLAIILTACIESENVKNNNESIEKAESTKDREGYQNSKIEPEILEVGDQKFEIFNYSEAFNDYVKAAKEEPNSLEELYSKTVTQKFRENAFGEGKGIEYMDYWFFTPPKDIIPLQSVLQALSDKEDSLHSAIEEALKNAAMTLPGDAKTVHVFPANPAYTHGKTQELNIPGVALNEDVIVLFVSSTLLEEELKHTVTHEYFHMVDMEMETEVTSSKSKTLLEYAIMEGKAEAFARLHYPDSGPNWILNQDGQVTAETIDVFLNERDSTEVKVWEDFYYGNASSEIPPFSTHIIGYEIMKNFLKHHPDMPVLEWLRLTPEEILAESGLLETKR